MPEMSNPKVFFEVAINNKSISNIPSPLRLEFEVYIDKAPKISQHFLSLCKGLQHNDSFVSYRGCSFFRIIPGFFAICGDIQRNNGSGSFCLDPHGFISDEENNISHNQIGLLSTYNHGPNTNDSQFIITLGSNLEYLNGRHTVFGKITSNTLENLLLLEKLGSLEEPLDPNDVSILHCNGF
ncbi:hypothetical protein RCL1_001861 [Eukaryota sp. TZLM3-RCL]